MTAFVMALAAGITVGSGPEAVSGEMAGSLPTQGWWQGKWMTSRGDTRDVKLSGVVTPSPSAFTVFLPVIGLPKPVPCTCGYWRMDEGRGAVRMKWSIDPRKELSACLGIYGWAGNRLRICFREENKGRPTSFRGGDGQHLLILYRVKPDK
jgi:hypothetical protein